MMIIAVHSGLMNARFAMGIRVVVRQVILAGLVGNLNGRTNVT